MPSMTQSIEKLQKKLDKDPNSLIFFQLAEEYRKEGNLQNAQTVLEQGLSRHPNYWSARFTLARIYHRQGNHGPAQEELERVVQAVPDHLLANRMLGEIYLGKQMDRDALKRFQIVQMLNPADQEVAAHVKKLEAEFVVPAVEPEPEIAVPQPAIPHPPPMPAPSVPEATAEPEPETYAPTIQMQVPQFEQTNEVEEIISVEEEAESFIETIPADVNPIQPFQSPASEVETTKEAVVEDDDDIVVESAEPILENLQDIKPVSPAEELSGIASLLLTPDDSDFQELEAELEDPSFEMEPEPELEEPEQRKNPTQDRTQPIAENEANEEGDELTTETLAELYLNQGLVDKAVKVYQQLLLNDPGNLRILQKLREINYESPEPFFADEKEEEEPVVVEAKTAEAVSSLSSDPLTQRAEERKRKINTLQNWLTTIRRDR
jgi:tetratricopeptide (TPR) repeat protein